MVLKSDLSGLPVQSPDSGEAPVPSIYGHRLAQAWADKLGDQGRPKAGDTTFRASWAGMCARALGYLATGVEQTEPPSEADYWRMGLGTIVHELLQEVLGDAFPGAEMEVKCTHTDLVSCHIDVVIPEVFHPVGGAVSVHPTKVSIEIKTINGFGFKKAIGARGPAEGPKTSHKLQAFIGAKLVDADECRIVYLSLENLSPRELTKLAHGDAETDRFVAEWAYARNDFEPVADKELARLERVRQVIAGGDLPPRVTPDMPAGARIVDPQRGAWSIIVDDQVHGTGSVWQCDYCDFRSRCIADGAS